MTSNGKALEKTAYVVGGLAVIGFLAWIGYMLYQIWETLNKIASGQKAHSDPIDVTPESATDSDCADSNLHNLKSNISPENAIVSQSEPNLKSDSHSDQNPDLKSESEPSFQQTEDFRTVKVKQLEYHVSFTQGRVVNRMWEHLKKGINQVHQDTLLEDLGVYSRKMKDVFKKSSAWKTLVVPVGKGFYRLNLL